MRNKVHFKKKIYDIIRENLENQGVKYMIIDKLLEHKVKTYAFVGHYGTGKSYRAQMVAGE